MRFDDREAITVLAALAHEARLSIVRTLGRSHPDGMSSGELARTVGISAPLLSFHVKELAHAGLVTSRREGKSIVYSAEPDLMAKLVRYLAEGCSGLPEPPAATSGPLFAGASKRNRYLWDRS